MNKTLLIAVVLIVAGAGIYFYTQANDNTSEVMEQATDTATKAADDAAAAAKAAEEAAAKVAEEAAAAEEAAKAAAAKAAEESAAATDAATSTENAITNALSGAVDAASEPAEGASNMATDSASADMSEDPVPTEQETLLTTDGFDAAKVGELIDGSDLDPMKKTLLKAAIEKAGENPEMVEAVIEQVKTALGM